MRPPVRSALQPIVHKIQPPAGEKGANTMKKLMKTFAMFTLSACMLAGGVLSSFAAGAPVITIQSHQSSSCEHTEKAEIVTQFTDAGGKAASYTICAECGKVNGESGLTKVDQATANFEGLKVYQGDVAGQRIMTVACLKSGSYIMKDLHVNVMMPRSSVEGYDLYQVNLDGTETKLEINGDAKWAHIEFFMADGAALVRMVPQA